MERQEFALDRVGQRLGFFADEGRPSATPSVAIADSSGAVITAGATTYVTQSAVNTTIAASVAAGAESLVVTSATGINVGDRYLMTNKVPQTEWIEVESIASTTIGLTRPLALDYTTLATNYGLFQSTEWYYTLQAADYAALLEMAMATATYAVGGLTYSQRLVFDVVRVPLTNPLTADALTDRWPDIWRQEPDEHRGSLYARQRATAWRIVKQRIRQHANAAGQWRPAMVFDPSDLMEFGFAVLKRELHLGGVEVDKDQPTRADLDSEVERERAAAFSAITLDLDEDGGQGSGEIPRHELDFIR